MLRLLITRHGETSYNIENRIQGNIDAGLTEVGIKQAEMLADHLKETPIDYVITGTLTRQVETGKKIATLTGITMISDSRLNERNWGRFNGRYEDEIDTEGIPLPHYLFLKDNPDDDTNKKIPKDPNNPGETIETVMKRVAKPYEELVAKYSESPVVTTVVVVSSQFANSYLLNYIAGNRSNKLPFYHQENMCIDEIRVSPIVTEVVQTNFMEHVHWRTSK